MFAEVIGSQKAILFLKDEGRKKFIPVSWRGLKEEDCREIDFGIESDLINYFLNNKKVLQLEIPKIRETFLKFNCNAVVATALARQDLFLYIPFFSNEKLVALLALGKSVLKNEITPREIESLTMLSSMTAVTIDNANLYKLSVQDGLTGVFIHRYFQQSLENKLTAGLEHMNRRVVSLFMVDIDLFKDINDKHGHPVGDQILKDVARIIIDNVRIVDTVARYGGEEFAVIIPEIDLKESSIMAERIRKSIEAFKFSDGDVPLKVTVSLGVATFPNYARNKDELIKQADMALYKSKQNGRNKVTLCSELQNNPAKTP
jgi:diguanylate cyclase (GGDEF)-like protein